MMNLIPDPSFPILTPEVLHWLNRLIIFLLGSGTFAAILRFTAKKFLDILGRIPEKEWFESVERNLNEIPNKQWFDFISAQVQNIPSKTTLDVILESFISNRNEINDLKERTKKAEGLNGDIDDLEDRVDRLEKRVLRLEKKANDEVNQ